MLGKAPAQGFADAFRLRFTAGNTLSGIKMS
ncbi:MAG: hypothetical protein UY82_C0038G0013 [Candidatus Uhrbacteria bacterium GW2011_GWC2_53_7]|uniref:Uncharacterized protein n=1 Tax=Candidatus Uhrbacteria bacterium GW2011_GWC2_53_7 TaxID=1618986 RepID=A0A0G1XWZ8_9BACT|nr:MAG: hypothetical protein UY82_C0038G0013 [Candidatus Uhrbacteria bacterium GW2011_GWC2_53_7]